MRIYPFFSSSSGNCTYIGDREHGLLIDCGVSYTRVKNALEKAQIPMTAVKAVLITHEHSDHIYGLKMLTKKTAIPVYARRATLDYLANKGCILSEAHDIEEETDIDGFHITAIPTMHDAVSPCAYRIERDGKNCAVCTDLGTVTSPVEEALRGVRTILLEANYDCDMLIHGLYPYELKERISSYDGHLSSTQSAEFTVYLVKNGTEQIISGHLSQNNNTPGCAREEITQTLLKNGLEEGKDYMYKAAEPENDFYFNW